jgi:fructokinase
VGDDPFGHYLDGVLRAENVDTRGLRFSHAARTALAFVSLRADGERSFVFYRHPSADMIMRPEDVAFDLIDGQDIFHYGSITLISEPGKSATLAAVDYARTHGLTISYDPNLRLSLWKDAAHARAGLLSGLDYAHIVKVSDEELVFLTGDDDPAALWRDGMRMILVTHGAGGATLHTRSQVIHAPGFRVTAVDTTGAGDGFVAGFLVSLLEHGDSTDALAGCLRFANAVGAITSTARGAIPALPTRAQVEAFLKAN